MQPSIFQRLFSLAGKVALVTGASGGLGRVLAEGLAEAGATVGLHGSTEAKLRPIQRAIEEKGRSALCLPGDLQEVDHCLQLVTEAHERLGRIDVLINCAGVNRRKPLDQTRPEDYEFIMAVNLRSVFFLCQAVHPIMRSQGGGKIINVGSVTSSEGLGGVGVYGASKSAVAQLTKTMALEWARDNIQVNCLAPGFMLTPLTETGLWGDPYRKEWLLGRIPARRPGNPDDLVAPVLLLAGSGAGYLTGQTINVDGGYLAGGSWLRDDE